MMVLSVDMMSTHKTQVRDKQTTQGRLLAAAKQVLAEDGFQGFGVNAVARAAGCDKQLIYRYFGGLDGLLDALGADLADWWGERLRPLGALGRPESYADLITRMALALLQALRDDPLMQKIVMWEMVGGSEAVQRLSAARSRSMSDWMARTRGDLPLPDGVDVPALNALLIGSVQHIVLAGVNTGGFAGMPLASENEWERVRRALKHAIGALYA